jgi:hypothetical protein
VIYPLAAPATQTNKTNEIKNGAARVVPRRPTLCVQTPIGPNCPNDPRVRRGWVATPPGAILIFGDKNLSPQVTDEFDRGCSRRQVQFKFNSSSIAARRKLRRPLAVVCRTSHFFWGLNTGIRHERPHPHRRNGRSGDSQSDIRRRRPPIHPPTRSPVLCRRAWRPQTGCRDWNTSKARTKFCWCVRRPELPSTKSQCDRNMRSQ